MKNAIIYTFTFLLCAVLFTANAQKIDLSGVSITLESGGGDPYKLIDEQSVAGDPKNGSGGSPSTNWQINWGGGATAYLDLGQEYSLSDVYYFDTYDNASVEFQYGSPGNWSTMFTAQTPGWSVWGSASVNVTTRYIRLIYPYQFSGINELVIYGASSGGGGDTQAPTAPTGLSSSNISSSSVDLSWNASSDNVGVTGYDVYKDGSVHTSVSGTSTTVSGLSASTSYEFKVKAKDAADNQSGFSNAINVTTSSSADTEAPTAPTGLSSSNVTSSSVDLSWNASSDNVGVTGYDVYKDGSVHASVSGTSTTVSGLSTSTSYEFKVKAKDAANNQSGFSNIINTTTNSSGGGGGCTTAKLTISGSMITNETGFGDATLIADEQSIAGDPANGMGGSPSNTWHAGWDNSLYPVNAYLDLGAPAQISTIYLRDVNDQGSYTVSAGNPGNWQVLFTDNLTGYQSWNEHSVSVTTQYLRFTMSSYLANMAEVVIYGCMGEDETAPGAITDFASTGKNSNSVSLSWTSTGDDGAAGTATSYDLRYSTSNITEANFDNATQVSGEPAPAIGGSAESFTVSGLSGGTNYYFALKVTDDAGNVSAISNIVNEATEVPDVTAPSTISNLATGSSTAATMALTWTAPGDDGSSGTASSYDIRYSQSNISSESDFNDATQVSGEPAPASAGTTETYTVSGLSGETTYYFAIKTIDESGNVSARSNTASGTTGSGYARESITVDQFMGINSFVDDPIEKMQAVGFVREYHNWNWDEGDQWSGGGDYNYPEYPNNEIKWAPSEAGGGLWNFDNFYTNVKNGGLLISPVIQQSVNWLAGGGPNKPLDESGANSTDPNSYEAKAHHMFQFAARYGSTPVADNLLTLDPGQPRNTGMGLIKYVEDWNEQDNTWSGPDAHFTAQEYAAMSSATYDGHGGTMTQGTGTFGIKNADPNMKFVMGGIWELNLQYIKDMETWYANNRPDGKFIPDVINVHHYAWNNPHPALSPEEDNFKTRLEEFTTWRDQNHPEVEVWITEFGWDTHPTSNLRVPTYGSFDQEEVQAQYLIRAWLAFAAAGVDRAAMFMLRNVSESSSVQFDNAGLTSSKDTGWEPKKSWYYTYTMKNALTGTRYLGEQSSGNANVWIYKFKSISDNSGVYVVWSPTANATTVNNYQLDLQGSPGSATQIEMVDNDTDGVATSLSISNGSVTVDVSERPVFIKVDNIQ